MGFCVMKTTQNGLQVSRMTVTSRPGVTLRENNLKELEGGHIISSQGVLVANKRALKERSGLLEVVHELIERFEAHLKAGKFYNVLANMRGDSAAEVCGHVSVSAICSQA